MDNWRATESISSKALQAVYSYLFLSALQARTYKETILPIFDIKVKIRKI